MSNAENKFKEVYIDAVHAILAGNLKGARDLIDLFHQAVSDGRWFEDDAPKIVDLFTGAATTINSHPGKKMSIRRMMEFRAVGLERRFEMAIKERGSKVMELKK